MNITLLKATLNVAVFVGITGFIAANERTLRHDLMLASLPLTAEKERSWDMHPFDREDYGIVMADDVADLLDEEISRVVEIGHGMRIVGGPRVKGRDDLRIHADDFAGLKDDFTGWEDIDESWACLAHHGSRVTV